MVGLYINNVKLPYIDDDVIPRITRKSYDIDNPDYLWSDYTKTVQVPATSEVNALFNHLYDVKIDIQNSTTTNFNPDFNPNLKAKARIDVDDITYISGYAQLNSITIDDFNSIRYNITIYGNVLNLFNNIGDAKLEDLDLSDLDHTWNQTEVVNSWTPTLGSGYVYPMIDYGVSTQYDLWDVRQFLPSVFAKEYFDRIFNAAGFTYTSNFLTSDLFKRLIIPYSGEAIRLSDTTIADRIFYVSRITTAMTGSLPTSVLNVASYPKLVFNDDSTGSNFNTATSAYSTSTGQWTVAYNGRYSFRGSMAVTITNTGGDLYLRTTDTNTRFKLAVVKKTGSTYTVLETIVTEWQGYSSNPVTNGLDSTKNTFQFSTNEHKLEAGDIVYLAVLGVEVYKKYLSGFLSHWYSVQTFDYEIDTDAVFTINLATEIEVGDDMPMSETSPQDVYQKDFIKSIFTMFNLFVDIDPDNPSNLIIEPYDDFFTGSAELTQYLDTLKPFTITPMAMLQGREYLFKYKEDRDQKNVNYKDSYLETFGTERKNVTNDFLTETKEVNVIFSPTLLIDNPQNDRIIPSMRFIDQDGNIKQGKTNIRILYWYGLKSTNKTWYIYQTLPTTTSKTSYPYAGHLDDPLNPTIDLSFGVPKAVYYNVKWGNTTKIYYTNANLYNTYWKRYIEEITDKNSKLIECHIKFDPVLWQSMTFRKNYYIKDAYYRLLEITDHAVDNTETTKCKFIKITPKQSFTGTTTGIRGGSGLFPTNEKFPNINSERFKGGNTLNPDKGVVLGGGNTGGGGVLVGDGIKSALVFKNTNNFGGNNNIMQGDNIVMLGTNDYQEWRDGAVISGGLWVWQKLSITLTGDEVATLNSVPIELLPPCEANEYYEIERFYANLDYAEAWTGGNPTLEVRTADSGNYWARITTGLYNASADAYIMGSLDGHPMDMGEAITLYASADVSDGSTNSVTFHIYYRINRL